MQASHCPAPSDGAAPRGLGLAVGLFTLLWVAGIYLYAGRGELLAEDFKNLHEAAQFERWQDALALEREPLRPLHHVIFYALARLSEPSPAWTRLPSFLLHLGSCWLVFRLAGALGAGARGQRAALLLFVLFPGVIALVTPAAVSGPGRAFFVLAALLAFLHGRRLATTLCFLLALAFHQGAIVLPALFAAWIVTHPTPGGVRALARRLADPLVSVPAALSVLYLVYQTFFRPQRFHGANSLASLPANTVRGALSLFPEPVRVACVEAFRGHAGTLAVVLAGLFFAVLAAAGLRLFVRGSPLARWVLLAVALELLLPILTTGFAQRYAYCSSGLVAAGLGAWLAPHARRRLPALAVLGLLWAADSVRAAHEYRAICARARAVLDDCRRIRAEVGQELPIAVLDLPESAGREQEILFFSLGFTEALELYHVPGRWVAWRSQAAAARTTSRVYQPPERLAEARRSPGILVLDYDPTLGRLAFAH